MYSTVYKNTLCVLDSYCIRFTRLFQTLKMEI